MCGSAVSGCTFRSDTRGEPSYGPAPARPTHAFENRAVSLESSPKPSADIGRSQPCVLKDLRKTCPTYYDEHLPESVVEMLRHAIVGTTYRHHAHRAPLEFRAIMTLPQPSEFTALAKGIDGQCPCCRRCFSDPN